MKKRGCSGGAEHSRIDWMAKECVQEMDVRRGDELFITNLKNMVENPIYSSRIIIETKNDQFQTCFMLKGKLENVRL